MKREEAHKLLSSHYSGHIRQGINSIYDDIESRTCENCKYLSNIYVGGGCEKLIGEYHFIPPKNFGCNKFERKQ